MQVYVTEFRDEILATFTCFFVQFIQTLETDHLDHVVFDPKLFGAI